MVLRTSFMRTKQFICLAARQSFHNLIEQYMELKKKESTNNQIISVGKNQIVPGYMEINPRQSAINMHISPIVHYYSQIYPVVSIVTTYNDVTILKLVMWVTYTKYLVKWITNRVLEIFGYFLNK
jgi:hypothetical protein